MNNDDLGAYVDAQEQASGINGNVIEAQPIIPTQQNREAGKVSDSVRAEAAAAAIKRTPETSAERTQRIERELNQIGWHNIPVNTLPTAGLFYPEDFEVMIRAARGEEIKHWSTMDDTEATSVNAMWNYIIEKCVNVRSQSMGASWRDLKEIDRLYILLAIRELTFIDEDNNLMVTISEGKNVPITKEMVHYVEIPEEIMRHYSAAERCFVVKMKNGSVIRMYVPSFGVTEWLTNYISQKATEQVGFDQDYVQYAQMLIGDYRNLTQRKYEEYVMQSHAYGVKEWSVISYIVDTLRKTLIPVFKYQQEDGTEQEVPVTFRGGVKAIFSIQDPLSELC